MISLYSNKKPRGNVYSEAFLLGRPLALAISGWLMRG